MSIATRSNSSVVFATWFNDVIAKLCSSILPLDSNADSIDLGGSLGSSSVRFSLAQIIAGDFSIGDIILHHSYNGLVPTGEGWMLCDGRLINQTNYDAEHGAGKWASEIGTSSLEGLYLPNLVGRYAVGSDTTTQDGAAPITSVGNAGNNRTAFAHVHKWYDHVSGTNVDDNVFNSVGSAVALGGLVSSTPGNSRNLLAVGPYNVCASDMWSSTGQNFGTVSIKPESIEILHYLRIL